MCLSPISGNFITTIVHNLAGLLSSKIRKTLHHEKSFILLLKLDNVHSKKTFCIGKIEEGTLNFLIEGVKITFINFDG